MDVWAVLSFSIEGFLIPESLLSPEHSTSKFKASSRVSVRVAPSHSCHLTPPVCCGCLLSVYPTLAMSICRHFDMLSRTGLLASTISRSWFFCPRLLCMEPDGPVDVTKHRLTRATLRALASVLNFHNPGQLSLLSMLR